MEDTMYTLFLLTREGMRVGTFAERIPVGKNGPNTPVSELAAIVSEFMNRGLDSLFIKYGLCHCHVCGREANLYMNTFIFGKSEIIDSCSALCGHGVCEVEAVKIRKHMLHKVAREVLQPPGAPAFREANPCVVCGEANSRACAGCKLTAYCGRDCQKKDWPQHKPVCKARRHTT